MMADSKVAPANWHIDENSEETASIDHFCMVVDDFGATISEFESLGFMVSEINRTSFGENALIGFSDGIYIELVRFKRRWLRRRLVNALEPIGLLAGVFRDERAILRRFIVHWSRAQAGQWTDWSLRVAPLDRIINEARSQCIDVCQTPYTASRRGASGGIAKWRMTGTMSPSLPFLIEDLPNSDSRHPKPSDTVHSNGARCLKKVILTSPNARETLSEIAVLSGLNFLDNTIFIGAVECLVESNPGQPKTAVKELIFSCEGTSPRAGPLDMSRIGSAMISLSE